jgi:hypothetical protein
MLFDYQTTAAGLRATFENLASGLIRPTKVLVRWDE